MKQEAVFQLISEEQVYQNTLGDDRTDGHQHSVGEELVLLDVYLRRAFDAWTDHNGDQYALDEVRKIAAIAVRCNHNAPSRSRNRD